MLSKLADRKQKLASPPVARKSLNRLNTGNSTKDLVELGAKHSDPGSTDFQKVGSLFSAGLSLLGAFSTGSAMAADASGEGVLDGRLHTMPEMPSDMNLSKIANPRFSEFDELVDLHGDQVIEKGAEGEHIQVVQQALLDMGFAIEAGPTGGLYNQTLNALNNFRASVGREARQDLDAGTLSELSRLAPPPGKTLAEHPTDSFPQAQIINGKPVRVIVNIKEHRLFLFDAEGSPEAVYPVATGKAGKPTDPGLKIVNYKYDDPSPVAWQLWPESQGKAFGTRMIDLKWYDAETGEVTSSDEEIHGTFNRNSIGTDASSGCVRLHNENVEALYPLLKKGDLVLFQ